MHDFVASPVYCRSHEAAVLNGLAKKALISVEEVGINELEAEMRWKRENTVYFPSAKDHPEKAVLQKRDMEHALGYLRYVYYNELSCVAMKRISADGIVGIHR